jgi:asparagine synthase (glutamine-hydrolysing)
MWRGIRRLEAAHVLTWTDGELKVVRHWQLERREPPRDPVDAAESHVARAVKEQLVADVPVGLFLSGGIDSSLVLAHAADTQRLDTFSIGAEVGEARAIARRLGVPHHEVIVSADDLRDPGILVDVFDEPFPDVAALPILALSRRARSTVKVVLTGDGGDEVFGGYEHHVLARWMRGGPSVLKRVARWAPGKAGRVLRVLGAPDVVRAMRSTLDAEGRAALYRPEFLARVDEPWDAVGGDPFDPSGDKVLADRFMYKTDMAAMSAGLETRSPLLDVPLAELVASLPVGEKVHGLQGKWLARRLLARRLPRSVWARKKTGLTLPVADWLRGPLAGVLAETVLAPRARVHEWVRADTVARLAREHASGREDHRRILWALLLLELWLRRR